MLSNLANISEPV